MTLMIDAYQRQSTENISKYFSDLLHSMTVITGLALLLPIDQIRSLELAKQEVEKSANVNVTISTNPSAYAKWHFHDIWYWRFIPTAVDVLQF